MTNTQITCEIIGVKHNHKSFLKYIIELEDEQKLTNREKEKYRPNKVSTIEERIAEEIKFLNENASDLENKLLKKIYRFQ
jgi:hypothetical protein